MTRRVLAGLLVVVASLAGAAPARAADPTFTVEEVRGGLAFPWDVAFLPQVGSAIPAGTLLYTERGAKRLTLLFANGASRVILDNPAGMWASGETGLMSVEPMANFATNRQFMTCHGYQSGGTTDIRVVLWQFTPDFLTASFVKNLVTGLPVSSGRHAGCAIARGAGYDTYVGTVTPRSAPTPRACSPVAARSSTSMPVRASACRPTPTRTPRP